MDAAVYFLLALVFLKGDALADSPVVELQAVVGAAVVLPCKVNVGEHPAAEWSKVNRTSDIVFVYQSNCETSEMKSPVYWHRTSLFMSEVNKGNFSLVLSNLRLSDAGTYVCKTLEKSPPQTVATVKLFVGAVSEPKLSIRPSVDGEVALQCDSGCWNPEPEVSILNPQGKVISDDNTKALELQGECFNTTRTVTVQNAGSYTCSVKQKKINQVKVAEIYIPDECMNPCTPLWKTITPTFVGTLLFTIGLFSIFYCWKCRQSVEGSKALSAQSSSQSLTSNQNYDERREIFILKKTIEDKDKTIHDKEKNIHKLTEELKFVRSRLAVYYLPTAQRSPSRSSPGVSKPNVPTDQQNPEPTKVNRPKSITRSPTTGVKDQFLEPLLSPNSRSPAPIAGCSAASAPLVEEQEEEQEEEQKEVRPLPRTKTLSFSHGNGAKSPRRSTISILSSNRYEALAYEPNDG